jgi:hypothetical protein
MNVVSRPVLITARRDAGCIDRLRVGAGRARDIDRRERVALIDEALRMASGVKVGSKGYAGGVDVVDGGKGTPTELRLW